MLFTRTNLPPFDKYYFFQEVNLQLNLSSITSHTTLDLWFTSKGKPRLEAGNLPTLYPSKEANLHNPLLPPLEWCYDMKIVFVSICLTLFIFFTVRIGNRTTVSFIWRLESHFCHRIWGAIGRLPFWVIWRQALPQLYFWLSTCGDRSWQVDSQSRSSTIILIHMVIIWFLLTFCFSDLI